MGKRAVVEFSYGESRVIAAKGPFRQFPSKLGILDRVFKSSSRRSQGESDAQALSIFHLGMQRENHSIRLTWHSMRVVMRAFPTYAVGVRAVGICRRVIARERSAKQPIQAQIKLKSCVTVVNWVLVQRKEPDGDGKGRII